jgi:hypothetical protein
MSQTPDAATSASSTAWRWSIRLTLCLEVDQLGQRR